jgi:sRNA-binding regulator protein Hfq
MLKNCLSLILIGLLAFGANVHAVFAQTQTADANAEKVKAVVARRGVNEKKRVRVKMLNGVKMKGYISRIGDDSFTLALSKTRQSVVIAYRDVSKIESGGLSGGARIGIIVGAAAGAALFFIYLAFLNAIENN